MDVDRGGMMAAGPPSVAAFAEQARQWLESRAPRRTADSAPEWGDGEFSVVVFHDASDEAELAVLQAYQAWHREKVAAGFGAIAVPSGYGGLGLTKAHEAAFKELEAEFDVPRDHEVLAVTSGLIAPTIEEYGTDEQRARFCRMFFQLDALCCQLFSEPGAGSDLAGLACKATRDGDEWILEGQKVWTSTARLAQYGFAICRTDPDVPKHAGMTAFLVPLDAGGIEIRPIRQMTGGASFNEVFLSGVRVSDDLRVGPLGAGWKVALTVLGHERAVSGSSRRGGGFDELLMLARHLGRTDEPMMRQGLARAFEMKRVREWTRSRAAAQAKATGSSGPGGSIGKLLWTQAMRQTSDLAGELLGPSLTADTGEWGTFAWNEHLLGAPGYRIAGGSDEIQRNIIGERVLGLPGEPRVDRDQTFAELARGVRRD
ncbi:MAG TPA: acyl-CoA dehydrogenase family protein [Acidimicrobiales bacterium]|nr:acyl-CoA dehydrogenase family protein [Acidimicrobiales bacterium]